MSFLCICVPKATPIILLETCLSSKLNYRHFRQITFCRLKPVQPLGIRVQLRGLTWHQLYSFGDFDKEPCAYSLHFSFVLPSAISSLDMIFVPRLLSYFENLLLVEGGKLHLTQHIFDFLYSR